MECWEGQGRYVASSFQASGDSWHDLESRGSGIGFSPYDRRKVDETTE